MTNINEIKPGTNKNFAIVFSIVFIVIGSLPYFEFNNFSMFCYVLSVFFFLGAFLYPSLFKYLNIAWFKFGMILGKFTSPIFLGLIYIIVFFPIGIVFKLFKKDSLRKKLYIDKNSYWIDRNEEVNSMNDQY